MKFLFVLLTVVVVIISFKSIEGYKDAVMDYSAGVRKNDNDVSNNSGYTPPPRDKVNYFLNDYDTWDLNPFSSNKGTNINVNVANTSNKGTSNKGTSNNNTNKATSNNNNDNKNSSKSNKKASVAIGIIIFVLVIIALFLALKIRQQ